jgi:hypothetical protein
MAIKVVPQCKSFATMFATIGLRMDLVVAAGVIRLALGEP